MTKLLLELNDEAIVAGFKATRNAQYFKTIFARHRPKLFRTALKFLGCLDDAEEIVQETFLRAVQNISEFKTNASLSAWLYAIAHNLCVDTMRFKHKYGESRQRSFDPQSILRNYEQTRRSRHVVSQIPDRFPDPAEQAELTEQMQIILTSLTSISAKQRMVVILHDVEGLPYEDIAALLKTNIGTIRSRLHYGRSRLKKILHPYVTHSDMAKRVRKRKYSKTCPRHK